MYRVVRSVYLDMAHRIRGHKSKCANIHGHTWKIEVCLSSDELNANNMVIDFGVVDELLLDPLERVFDHCWLIGKEDASDMRDHDLITALRFVLGASLKLVCLPIEVTAETLAKYFYERFAGVLDDSVNLEYVRVYEKLHPKESYAEYRSNKGAHGHCLGV